MRFTRTRSAPLKTKVARSGAALTVLLVGNYEPQAQESMHRFAKLMADSLTRQGINYESISPPAVLGRFGHPHRGLGKWLGYLDKFILFAPIFWLKARRSTIVHICDHSNSPYLRLASKAKTIITCHDALAIRSALNEFPENRVSKTGRLFQMLIGQSLGKANHLVCVSTATEKDLRRLGLLRNQSCTIIPLPLNFDYHPVTGAEASRLLSELSVDSSVPYFMHVGGNQWYKNRVGVLMLFSELIKQFGRDERLLMFGKDATDEMVAVMAALGLTARVQVIVGATNAALRAAYSNAEALLFPSLAEGFGWPIIEAQACGCPVITSNVSPMSDVAGTGAILIDPTKINLSARVVHEKLQLAREFSEKGFNNVKKYSLENFDRSYASIYADLGRQR